MDFQPFTQDEHLVDEGGMPAGGFTRAMGLDITWQAGPLGQGKHRKRPNGTFVETVLRAGLNRLIWYQVVADGKFADPRNEAAIGKITSALSYLSERTTDRETRGVEGTHEP